MTPVTFKGQNIVFGENQAEYQPLPALKVPNDPQGSVITCWELSPEEIEEVKLTGKIYLNQLTFNQALQPVLIVADLSDLFAMSDG
jgi:hypothetical protein